MAIGLRCLCRAAAVDLRATPPPRPRHRHPPPPPHPAPLPTTSAPLSPTQMLLQTCTKVSLSDILDRNLNFYNGENKRESLDLLTTLLGTPC